VNPLLQVDNLHVYFDTPAGVVRANNGVNIAVMRGQSLGIMGESGCGKTVMFLSLLHLQQPGRIVSGRVLFDGRDITALTQHQMQSLRGRAIALVPQNQATALNPSYTVRQQLIEAISVRRSRQRSLLMQKHRKDRCGSDKRELEQAFRDLGFEPGPTLDRVLQSYPHQLSGGMRQRVLIAMAVIMRPRLLIADEPTTALDRAIKSQALDTLQRLRAVTTLMVISHDVETISATCDRVAIMYAGRVIEEGTCPDVLLKPHHPYSRLLLASQARVRGLRLPVAGVETLDLVNFPPGCPFHPACPQALPDCRTTLPQMYSVAGATVACHLYRQESA